MRITVSIRHDKMLDLSAYLNDYVFTPWLFRPKGFCRCLRLSVRPSVGPSVSPSVRKLYLVRTITRHRFEFKSPNLHQTCIMGYSRLTLKIGVVDLDLQGHLGHFDLEFEEIWLVRAITRHRFGLESPNLHHTCILGYSWLIFDNGSLTWTFQVILTIFT